METERLQWTESINSLIKWNDTHLYHRLINSSFTDRVNETPELKALRDWVEPNIWGFGERSFYWMWYLIVKEMPEEFTFMEIGVFRGQILALIKTIANMLGKKVTIIGISPMNSTDGYWESNYEQDVETIFDKFNLDKDYIIIKGLSSQSTVIQQAHEHVADILFIDGGHSYENVKSDMTIYLPLLKKEGFLIMDDCASSLNLPSGFFRGHATVSKAVDEVLPPFTENPDYKFLFNVVHDRVWKKLN